MRNIQRACIVGLVAMSVVVPVVASQDPPPQPARRQAEQPAQRGRGQGLPAARPGMPIQQMQSMFDAYALVQAQRVLQLNDEQYQRFFTRMNRLQDVRRQHTQQRTRLLNELRRKWRPQGPEAELIALTRELDDLETTFGNDVRAARLAIDEVLTVRQKAAFRFFEEDMERQKVEFITRSRQGARSQ